MSLRWCKGQWNGQVNIGCVFEPSQVLKAVSCSHRHILVNEIVWLSLGFEDTWLWVQISTPVLTSSGTLRLTVKLWSHIAFIWEDH